MEAVNLYRDTPLHAACRSGKSGKDIAKLLKGDNIFKRNGEGKTSIEVAIEVGNFEALKVLARRAHHINGLSNGDTPLHRACRIGRSPSVIARLIGKKGWSIFARNDQGKTPIEVAIEAGKFKVLPVLVQHANRINIQ